MSELQIRFVFKSLNKWYVATIIHSTHPIDFFENAWFWNTIATSLKRTTTADQTKLITTNHKLNTEKIIIEIKVQKFDLFTVNERICKFHYLS